ncbi:MAG: AAA family ATPase [Bacteroidaceae bacterium]|nr:AAA family ATPase [Bacteroidaceae bacterium]
MVENTDDRWVELSQEITAAVAMMPAVEACYTKMWQILERVCRENLSEVACSSNLFSCLYVVCRRYGIDFAKMDLLRRRIKQRMDAKGYHLESIEVERDADVLLQFCSNIYKQFLPKKDTEENRTSFQEEDTEKSLSFQKKLRAVVAKVEHGGFKCVVDGCGAREYVVKEKTDQSTARLLEVGMTVNLLEVTMGAESLDVTTVVLEPDYLIDVSALAACYKPYGHHPCNYLIAQLAPYANSSAILLGNAANQFMEDAVGPLEDIGFRKSVKKHFRNALLGYTYCQDPIDSVFFQKAEAHYNNIKKGVEGLFESPDYPNMQRGQMLMESSFVCEALGLRGRFDVMAKDRRLVLELKSGKADDYGAEPRPKKEHVLQMSLYKEMLHYNLDIPREEITTLLFYSAYPQVFDEYLPEEEVNEALHLRNRIVKMCRFLQEGRTQEVLREMTLETLNQEQLDNKLYHFYLKPQLLNIIAPIAALDEVERAYFVAYLSFVFREMYYSKIGDGRADSNRGFASLWLQAPQVKQASGDMLSGMLLNDIVGEKYVETLTFVLQEDGQTPNFSVGEMVQLYECANAQDNVTNKQVFRAYIEELTDNILVLQIANVHYELAFFEKGRTYAVEHDASDVVFIQELKGLFSFCIAPKERRELLLGKRAPKFDMQKTLQGNYGEQLNSIVLSAKRAEDFFLLMGPPGTGKTSRALKAIVQEFLLERALDPDCEHRIMLLAYTNRAVDEICSMLLELQKKEVSCDFIRFGKKQTCDVMFRTYLLEEKAAGCSDRKEIMALLRNNPIFVGTVSTMSAYRDLYEKIDFDMAVVDEASQLIEPQLVGLLSAIHAGKCAFRKFILIGDHKQLPAVVLQQPKETEVEAPCLKKIGFANLSNSLFERLWTQQSNIGKNECMAMLHVQGRMHTEIADFVSRAFYSASLQIVPLSHQVAPLPEPKGKQTPLEHFVSTSRLGFLHVQREHNDSNLKVNLQEAMMVAELINALQKIYEQRKEPLNLSTKIGVIVPFRAQISVIKKILRRRFLHGERISVDTVECYQGSQRDIIIYSTTISRRYQLGLLSVMQEVDGVAVDRKLNVAITRARKQLFILGDRSILSTNGLYRDLIEACDIYNEKLG